MSQNILRNKKKHPNRIEVINICCLKGTVTKTTDLINGTIKTSELDHGKRNARNYVNIVMGPLKAQ